MKEQHNFPITPLLRWLTTLEVVVVFISGFGLFFLPQIIGTLWPWELAPFNTRFMGAIYGASFVSAGVLAWKPYWSPARIVVPMIFGFTGIVLLVSIVYFDRFERPSTAFWFILYIVIPINALYHLWLYRAKPPADAVATQPFLRSMVLLEIVVIGGYGVALLIAPDFSSSFWSWDIDAFHGRMYSVAYLTPAIGAFFLLKHGSALEFFALGWTQVVGSVLAIVGLVIVDSTVKRVDWGGMGTWLWLGLAIIGGLIGVFMLQHAQKIRMKALPTLS